MSTQDLLFHLDHLSTDINYGYVQSINGLIIESSISNNTISIGTLCFLHDNTGVRIPAEVIGFRPNVAYIMPFTYTTSVGPNSIVEFTNNLPAINPSEKWLGRVIDGLAQPLDEKGALSAGDCHHYLFSPPTPAHKRKMLGEKINIGVRAMNLFTPCCRGQRLGVFAGSGVGKSTLLGMIARYTDCEVIVIGLIGERGREVNEFLQNDLGKSGLARSVVVVATSDQPAALRRRAAYVTMAIAEYFCHQGKQVLCLLDSVTRFAFAQREIGLALGEPPSSRGFTPSVFAELPRLLERAGPGKAEHGDITGIFSVLVDGDDHNEPISDAVRGILDGHIVLERKIQRYPPINVIKSISRNSEENCYTHNEKELIKKAKKIITNYESMEDLIKIDAYKQGSNPEIDEAIRLYPKIENLISQSKQEQTDFQEAFNKLREIISL